MCPVAAGLLHAGVPGDLGCFHFMRASCTKVRDEKTVAEAAGTKQEKMTPGAARLHSQSLRGVLSGAEVKDD